MQNKTNIFMELAKTKPRETIGEHTQHLYLAYQCLEKLYGELFSEKERKSILLAALFHDLGKGNYDFIRKTYKSLGKAYARNTGLERLYNQYFMTKTIPHGYLSPAFLNLDVLIEENYSDTEFDNLINAIVYHHTRDIVFDEALVQKLVEQDLEFKQLLIPKTGNSDDYNRLYDIYGQHEELSLDYTKYVREVGTPISDKTWAEYAVIKGILNRLDYWASSDRELPLELSPKTMKGTIAECVMRVMKSKHWDLRDLQKYMLSKKDHNLVLIASTGLGKTEGALLWLDGSKGFYTLPLRVSINAIYDRIKDDYTYPPECLGLLHGEALGALLSNNDKVDEFEGNAAAIREAYNKVLAARKFTFPLTVCTIDQLFKFIFKYRSSELLLATLKYSKLIIDEIQSYSPEVVGEIIYGLKLIKLVGGKFAIMTATLPPVFLYFLQKEKLVEDEVVPAFLDPKKRHKLELRESDFDYEQILSEGKTKKVLVICNTVKKAKTVYQRLHGQGVKVNLLHSQFLRKDRSLLEEAIKKFAASETEAGIWVTTQIVEASLDIDFDYLHTEMSTADSLLQRLGRCFRKREYTGKGPNVFVYVTLNGISGIKGKSVYDKEIYQRSLDALKPYLSAQHGFFTEADKMAYINEVYDTEALRGSNYFKKIAVTIQERQRIVPGILNKEDADRLFRNISSTTYMPIEIYEQLLNDKLDKLDDKIDEYRKTKDRTRAELIKEKILNNTMSLSYKPKKVLTDTNDLFKVFGISIIRSKYDFDPLMMEGQGLLPEEEADNCI
jgi:CRISPR-associated endonuclease/helicase Cas3